MLVDNPGYTIKDANGEELATVVNGEIQGDDTDPDRVFEQRTVNIFGNGSKGKKNSKVIYSSASQNRSIESHSGGLSYSAMDGEELLSVKTDAQQATFDVAKKEVGIPLKEGESFEINMTGADAKQELSIAGTGTGASEGAKIKVDGSGKLNIANVEVKELNIGGKSNETGRDIDGLVASLERYCVKYDGTPKTPKITVTDGSKTLTEGVDYVASYNDNTLSGNAFVNLTGIGAYRGKRNLYFTIGDKDRDDLANVHFYLNGHGTVEPDDRLVEKGTAVGQPANPLAAGYQFEGWYADEECKTAYDFSKPVEKDMTIYANWTALGDEVLAVAFSNDPSDGQIVSCDAKGEEPYCIYTGEDIKPAVVVTFGSRVLKEGKDYSLTYSNNSKVTAGSKRASVKISLKGDFSGSKSMKFVIRPKSLDDGTGKAAADIIVDPIVAESGKKAGTPDISYGDYVLSASDFVMSPKNPVAGKDATVSIKGKGNFTGEITDIPVTAKTKAEMKDYRISAALKLDKPRIYNGTAQTLGTDELKVTVAKSGYVPVKDRDYTVRYNKNVNAGTAKVTVIGKGLCHGKVTKKFRINTDKSFELSDIAVADEEGPVYCVPDPATPELKLTRKDGRQMVQGRDYKVTYSDNKKPGKNAKFKVTFIGNYKGRKESKGKFEIVSAPFEKAAVTATDLVYLKAGKLKPEVAVMYDGVLLKNKEHYTYKLYRGEVDVTKKKLSFDEKDLPAKITLKVTGKGGFTTDTVECSFDVYALPDGAFDLTDAKIVSQSTNSAVKKQDYTGREVKPAIDVYAKAKGSREYAIVPAQDYKVTYYDNINRGTAKIVVTGDNKNSFGKKTGKFTIGVRKFRDILHLIFGAGGSV